MTKHQLVDIDVLPMECPSDVQALHILLDTTVDPRDVVAVIGKSEGSGLDRDPDRETADLTIRTEFARQLGIPVDDVSQRLCMVLSGGTPGVLSPHIAVVSVRWLEGPEELRDGDSTRLTVGTSHSRAIPPEDVGRLAHVSAVRAAVEDAMEDAGIADPSAVHLVLVKAPSISELALKDATRRGVNTVTSELGIGPNGAMCYSNDASALGVACALREIDGDALTASDIRTNWSLFSEVAMTSSGGEKTHAEVLLFGNSAAARGNLRIGHQPMESIVDNTAVGKALMSAGLDGPDIDHDRIVYLLAKMIIPGSDRLFGHRITLQDDPQGYHVAKAMGGYLLASTTGQTMCFVSGGERNSHQGPPDGNPLAAIVRIL